MRVAKDKMTVIKRQSVLSTVYSYLGVGVGVITQGLVIPNYFSTEENGLMALLLSWMYILTQLSGLGFNNAGTKFFSYFRNAERGHNGYLSLGLRIQAAGAVVVLTLFFLFRDVLISYKSSDKGMEDRYMPFIIPLTIAALLFNLFDNYAKGLHNTVAGSFYSQFLQRFFLLVSTVPYVLGFLDFEQFLWLWLLAICAPSVLLFFSAKKLDGYSLVSKYTDVMAKIRKPFFQFAMFSVITGLSSMIILQLDKIMVHKYIGLGGLGIYNIPLLFASVMSMPTMALTKAASAIIIDKMDNGEWGATQSIYRNGSTNLYIFGFFIFVVAVSNLDEAYSFIKPEYAAGKMALIIIGVSKLYDLMNGLNGLIFSNSQYYKLDSIVLISFVFVLLVLNRVLIPEYGINGAAAAALLSVIYYNSVRTYLVWYLLKIHPFSPSLIMTTVLGVGTLFIGHLIPDFGNPFANIGIKGISLSIIFWGLHYVLGVSPELNALLNKIVRLK